MIRFRFTDITAAVVVMTASCVVCAQSARVHVVEWDLTQTIGSLELLEADRAAVLDDAGERTLIAPEDIAFIEFISTVGSSGSTGDIGEVTNGLLRLVNGTRYTGWAEVEDDNFVWRNWWAGTVRPDLDEITSFVEHGRNTPPYAATEDLVVLANGDRIDGLVLDIGENIEVERMDGKTVRMPIERVKSVALVNPPQPSKGTRVWLLPGDEVPIESFRFDAGIGLRVGDHESLLPGSITAIAFDVGSIMPLSSVESVVSEIDGSPRYRIPKPKISAGAWPLDAPWIEISGPLRAKWKLDSAGLGFVARAVLPSRARRFGIVRLVVLDGDKELYSTKLDHRSPVADVAVRLPGDTLTIELREEDGSPLQDTVRLERALLLEIRE